MNIIFDTDPGIDDALALALLSSRPDIFTLKALSTVFGNTGTRQADENALRLLHLLNLSSVPVVEGSLGPDGSVYKEAVYLHNIHGDNGVGNVKLPPAENEVANSTLEEVWLKAIGEAEETVIVALGPLKNLASFLPRHPELKDRLKIVIMGGNYYCKGNVSAFAEANIYKDPESANIVFSSGFDITLVPLDVTEKTILSEEVVKSWKGEIGTFYKDMLTFYIAFHEDGNCFLHDPSTILYLMEPSLYAVEEHRLSVVLEGEEKGRLYDSPSGGKVRVLVDVKDKEATALLVESVAPLFS